ncbi:hypothetical protein C1H46_015448 [Malus baccata]|uniref:Inhibitor I9 domain-containing protein n=1 Tax=Malus baccata TaxID=106549 RepID=A0A540MJM5_MALBA|nr:hypothetical protein C1H46_015448 [Malus baccata]
MWKRQYEQLKFNTRSTQPYLFYWSGIDNKGGSKEPCILSTSRTLFLLFTICLFFDFSSKKLELVALLHLSTNSRELASELMVYSYKHGFSGFAAKLTESQTQQLSELPGVVRIIPNRLHKLETTRSWDFLGLSPHSPSNILPKSNMGDGVIIGVLDTGVDY